VAVASLIRSYLLNHPETPSSRLAPALSLLENDLDTAAELYNSTMNVWKKSRECLQLNFHETRYEDVVENLEKESRALLEFLQVPWSECVLNYHTHARDKDFINTPSYSQVTQPIYQRAKYRWKHYSENLVNSEEKVQPYIEYFGY
jgi:hypothetical protein